ncbi:hypothetical protein HWI79_2222 [Cryptosporidium felis]|nr:hypothetical protein HWI79_2222 [Cryptosporidium felis]
MKRKFSNNNIQVGGESVIKGDYSNQTKNSHSEFNSNNGNPYNFRRQDRNKKNSLNYNSTGQGSLDNSNKGGKRSEYLTKKLPSDLIQRVSSDAQNNRSQIIRRERGEKHLLKKERKDTQLDEQHPTHSKGNNTSSNQTSQRKNDIDAKKIETEASRGTVPVEDCISSGIRMQLVNNLLGKSEFQSLVQSVFNFLNSSSNNVDAERSKCILFLDYLILRTKKLSEMIESSIQDSSNLLNSLEEDEKKLKLQMSELKKKIYDNMINSNSIQSLWNKCEILSEQINSLKRRKDIQCEIESALVNRNEIKTSNIDRKKNFNNKIKLIKELCLLLSRLTSKQ